MGRSLLFVVLLYMSAIAHASTMTDNIQFTATDSSYPSVTGSYTLTFDPSVTYNNATAGLTVSSLSYMFSPPISSQFSYDAPSGFLVISGGNGLNNGSNAYALVINHFITAPHFNYFEVTSASMPGRIIYGTATLQVTTVTPEPSVFILCCTGLLFTCVCLAPKRLKQTAHLRAN